MKTGPLDSAFVYCAKTLGIKLLGYDDDAGGWWIMGPAGRGWISRDELERAGQDGEREVVRTIVDARDRLRLPKRWRFRIGRKLRQ